MCLRPLPSPSERLAGVAAANAAVASTCSTATPTSRSRVIASPFSRDPATRSLQAGSGASSGHPCIRSGGYGGAMDRVEVRRSPRARNWRLEVPWGAPARLTVPRWTTRAEVEQLLAEKRAWVEEQRRQQVPRLGLEQLSVSESEARVAARQLVSMLAEDEAERIGVAYRRIRIGGQRTLGGSCSVRGTLSFNWRLVLAPL